jgi:putative copper export protein
MHTLYLVSVFLHVVAAMAWVGGMIFLVAVVVPALRKDRDALRTTMQTFGVRFRTVGWVALVTLVATGLYNLLHRGYSLGDIFSGEVFAGQWGHILAHKLAVVAVILVLSAVHDFYVGPRATREGTESLRAAASALGRVTFACALAVVALAVALVRG